MAAFAVAAILSALPYEGRAEFKPVPLSSPSDVVYATASGKRYHHKECRYAKTATATTRAEAEAKGLTPCKVCKP